jgi:hypothetical protein
MFKKNETQIDHKKESMSMNRSAVLGALGLTAFLVTNPSAYAACGDISWQDLSSAADYVKNTPAEQALTGGLLNNMWVSFTDQTGKVCAVVNTAGRGQRSGQTWGLSRVISAQKANTSAMLSLDEPVQPWASGALIMAAQPVLDPATGLVSAQVGALQGTLFGVQFSNPVDTSVAYAGNPSAFGTPQDPLKNQRLGGVNVFGGGLPMYSGSLKKIGAIGVSGDTSCTDHAFAWRVRERLASQLGLANAAAIAAAGPVPSERLNITGLLYPGCGGPTPSPLNGID